jgi:signal transduction histidine kinase
MGDEPGRQGRYDRCVTGTATIERTDRVTRSQTVLVAAAACLISVIVMFNGGVGVTHVGVAPAVPTTVLLVVASTMPLVLRDRFPLWTFATSAVATAIMAVVVFPIGLPIGPAVGLYTIAVYRSRLASTASARTTVVAAGLAIYFVAAAVRLSSPPWAEMFHGALLWAAFWFAGERTRLQRQQIDDLKQAALRERHLAAASERARIARDLHDSAGHAINVIAIRAGAARIRHHEDPGRSLAALLAIEELARQTAEDIDHFVGALRSEADADIPPVPRSLTSIDSLVALHAEAGLLVSHQISGESRPLHPSVDQAAYRIVQETLTNASRHGQGTADLIVGYTSDAVTIEVTNPSRRTDPHRLGHGLLGATERATQLGGELHTALLNGVFSVDARLPYRLSPESTAR